jgi:arylformamidase
MAQGASVNVGRVTTSWHVGTHADAPLHVARDGAASESLPLPAFAGDAHVVDASALAGDEVLSAHWLADQLPAGRIERVLLRTGASVATGHFPNQWPTLDVEAVASLVARGLLLLGTDAPSVDARTATDLSVHRALFDAGACVLENLRLLEVAAGPYVLTAYPVLVAGADAAPVRAVLAPH